MSTETSEYIVDEHRELPSLTLGFCTRDDQMAWMTLNLFFELHEGEFDRVVIIDNSPKNSAFASELKKICAWPQFGGIVEYHHEPGPPSSVYYKDRFFAHVKTDYGLFCDSHVYFPLGAVRRLREHLASPNHDERDLVTGPCQSGYRRVHGTNQMIRDDEPYPLPEGAKVISGYVVRGGVVGAWVFDDRAYGEDGQLNTNAPAYEAQQQGTGAFCMSPRHWPGVSAEFTGHGGNETMIMELVRRGGGRVMILPGFPWSHCFYRPQGPPYKPSWPTRAANYLRGAKRLDDSELYDAVSQHITDVGAGPVVKEVQRKMPRPSDLYEQLLAKLIQPGSTRGAVVGGAIPRELFEWLRTEFRASRGLRTLEFGCGLSTLLFDKIGTRHLAIEQSAEWVKRVTAHLSRPETTTVLHSPLEKTVDDQPAWYQYQCVVPDNEEDKFSVVLIDGPLCKGADPLGRLPAAARVPWADVMAGNSVIVIDDAHRQHERELCVELEQKLVDAGRRVRGVDRGSRGRVFRVLRLT